MKKSSTSSLKDTVRHLAHLLPAQGPIGVFIHHNTLHAFQHFPFEEAVVQAAALYGAEPYMTEAAFRREFEKGRITVEDIDAALAHEPNDTIVPFLHDRRQMRRQLLLAGAAMSSAAEVRWWLEEGGATKKQRELFDYCLEAVKEITAPAPQQRLSAPFDGLLIRLCATFLDQGVAHCSMPGREKGFLYAVRRMLAAAGSTEPVHGLSAECRKQQVLYWGAEATCAIMLERLKVAPTSREHFLRDELLALPGWAGLFHRLEEAPELAPHERLNCSLLDYLAVRLTFRWAWQQNGAAIDGSSEADPVGRRLEAGEQLFHAVKTLSLQLSDLHSFSHENWACFRSEAARFDDLERRRIWQLAYELRHERLTLTPLATRLRNGPLRTTPALPCAQVFFCIDEREESIRRHLEEIEPRIETFGAAGFFGVAVDYAGIDDAHGVSLCPVVVRPQHAIREEPVEHHRELAELRQARRRLWAQFAKGTLGSSRTLWLGWLSTAMLGLFSLFPLLIRVLAPRRYGLLREKLNDLFLPEARTELTLMRQDEHSHEIQEGLQLGFTTAEKVERVASVLAPMGLTRNFAPLVIVLGHGSTSLNNPHESAHDCGACGGRRGGPNARLFAAMANRPNVRTGLRERGIDIPDSTWFVGGYHDTSSDEIQLFDVDAVPASHTAQLVEVREKFDAARAASALERCRRFASAERARTPLDGLHHVEERAEHLAEPRPEYGHCTNAVTVIGRRELTRGLFLDRRWFLISYDPANDPDDENLARLLAAGGPVCAGISLEYYFSFVDNLRYGCGTKLPHNITGLVGVMDGHASDLRTGLPWQMVEIHEPVRSLFVVETSPARLQRTIARLPAVEELVRNRWVRVATVDPTTGEISVLRPWGFETFAAPAWEIPRASSSREWYAGKMDHLAVAEIGALVSVSR